MKILPFALFLFISFIAISCMATNNNIVQYNLLNNDHGILINKNQSYPVNVIKITYNELKRVSGKIYWQCFTRDKVSISLQDKGYSSEDLGWKENHSNLVITVYENEKIKHEYTMRRFFGLSNNHVRFLEWIKLMKNEPYVCLAGRFIDKEKINSKYDNHTVFSWIFDAIKTKKGSDSYL